MRLEQVFVRLLFPPSGVAAVQIRWRAETSSWCVRSPVCSAAAALHAPPTRLCVPLLFLLPVCLLFEGARWLDPLFSAALLDTHSPPDTPDVTSTALFINLCVFGGAASVGCASVSH